MYLKAKILGVLATMFLLFTMLGCTGEVGRYQATNFGRSVLILDTKTGDCWAFGKPGVSLAYWGRVKTGMKFGESLYEIPHGAYTAPLPKRPSQRYKLVEPDKPDSEQKQDPDR